MVLRGFTDLDGASLRAGESGILRIRQFNTMKDDAPDFWDVQIQLRGRFNTWKQAWWLMHKRVGLDGRPPVQEIHDLALIRARGTSMDEIEVNARVILEALNSAAEKKP